MNLITDYISGFKGEFSNDFSLPEIVSKIKEIIEKKIESLSEDFVINDKILPIGLTKFGCIVGDNSKIGANAVLSPGTILPKNSIVKRLQLIEQL